MNRVERVVRAVDRFQTRHPVVAVPAAVLRKFADDRGSAFAALLTYYAFLALFPLLILGLTVLARVMETDPAFRKAVLDSVVGQFPVIGGVLRDNVQALRASGVGLLIGGVGLLWGATGLYNSGQLAMSQLWNVEGVDRPGFLLRLVRATLLFAALGIGTVAGAWLLSVGVFDGGSLPFAVAALVVSTLFNTVLFLVVLRIMTPQVVPLRQLLLGSGVAAVAWQVVQSIGTYLVRSRLAATGDIYGVFAYVLGSLAWLYLAARILLLATEVNVVVARRLWPRRFAQPPLLEADKRVLDAIVRNERRRPEQHIEVRWDDDTDERSA